VIAGVVLALAAPVVGAFDRVASIAVFLGAAIALGWARVTILYRAGWVPDGLDLRRLRRLRVLLALFGTPLLLASLLATLACWSFIAPPPP